MRASHDDTSTYTTTDAARSTAAAAAVVGDAQGSPGCTPCPALCAPAHSQHSLGIYRTAAVASRPAAVAERYTLRGGKGDGARGGRPAGQVAETPQARRGRSAEDTRGAYRGSSSSRRREDRERADGSRGRSVRRREASYDPRGASMSTNRERYPTRALS